MRIWYPQPVGKHILKGEGVHDQPESFVVKRELGLQEPPGKTSLPPVLSLSSSAHAFRNSRGMSHATVVCFLGFVFEIETPWPSRPRPLDCARRRIPSERRRLLRSAAQHSMEAVPPCYDVQTPQKTHPQTPVGGAGACGAVGGVLCISDRADPFE